MPRIIVFTKIKAEISVVFNLSRSIELHLISSKENNEKVIGGRRNGLIKLGETVTWRAKHLGIYQNLTSKIIGCETDAYFADEMISGAFKSFKHEHYFFKRSKETFQVDILEYESPFGVLGRLVDFLFLKNYMTRFLKRRNRAIKEYAESEKWKEIIKINKSII